MKKIITLIMMVLGLSLNNVQEDLILDEAPSVAESGSPNFSNRY